MNPLLIALSVAMFLLAGCATKTAERMESHITSDA